MANTIKKKQKLSTGYIYVQDDDEVELENHASEISWEKTNWK
jgi:hypothetical protein